MHVRDNNLIAATHGRSFWIIDDLSPLHQLSDDIASADHHLYQPKPSYRMAQGGGWGSPNTLRVGENHPNGVLFNYFIKEVADSSKISIEIKELSGASIRKFSNTAKKDKLKVKKEGNRFVWDMRYKGFETFPGMVLYSSPNRGPKAPPGKYLATLTIDGKSIDQEFEIIKDPRMPNTDQDYVDQFGYLMEVRDQVSEAHKAINDIRSVKEDIKYFQKKLGDDAPYKEVLALAKALSKDMSVIENNIHMTKNQSRQDPLNYGIRINNRLAFLLADQQRGDYPPTDQAIQVKNEVSAELAKELEDLDQLLLDRITEINKMGKDLGIQIISKRVQKLVSP